VIFPNTFPTDLSVVFGSIQTMLYGKMWVYAALLALGLFGLWAPIPFLRQRPRPAPGPIGLLTTFILVSLAAALLTNLRVQSFMDRRIIFLLPALALLLGHLLSGLPRAVALPALLLATLITALAPRPAQLTGNWFFRQAVEAVEQGWQPGDALLIQFNDENQYAVKPLLYYAQRAFPPDMPVLTLQDYTLDNEFNQGYFANQVFADYVWTRDRFWVIHASDPELGLAATDWVDRIQGRTFRETETIQVGWMVVSLFTAPSPERSPQPQGVDLPETPVLPQAFGDVVELVGYQVDRLSARPGETITVWLDWRALRAPGTDYAIYLHLLEGETILHGQGDGDPTHLGRAIPTVFWAAGAIVYDTRSLTVSEDTPPGVYTLKVGLYDRISQARLPTGQGDGVVLALIEVR
jgi:hypothetical protein